MQGTNIHPTQLKSLKVFFIRMTSLSKYIKTQSMKKSSKTHLIKTHCINSELVAPHNKPVDRVPHKRKAHKRKVHKRYESKNQTVFSKTNSYQNVTSVMQKIKIIARKLAFAIQRLNNLISISFDAAKQEPSESLKINLHEHFSNGSEGLEQAASFLSNDFLLLLKNDPTEICIAEDFLANTRGCSKEPNFLGYSFKHKDRIKGISDCRNPVILFKPIVLSLIKDKPKEIPQCLICSDLSPIVEISTKDKYKDISSEIVSEIPDELLRMSNEETISNRINNHLYFCADAPTRPLTKYNSEFTYLFVGSKEATDEFDEKDFFP